MSRLTITSNILSLNAQRQLGLATNDLATSLARLSSGLRINKASDDAAGLSIASLLTADKKVFNQGVRNINDGISYLSVAEGAVTELKSILFRIQELITQSSSGTLSNSQREPLNEEAQALSEEYNRILSTAEFNGIKVLSEKGSDLSVQAGYGTAGTIDIFLALGSSSSTQATGDGTFGAQTTYNVGAQPVSVSIGDFDGDGISDLATANFTSDNISVLLGNGDGTFAAQTTYAAGDGPQQVSVGDFDGDGISDLAVANSFDDNVGILLGNGDGTFAAHTTYGVGSDPRSVSVGDFNGDGIPDLATANQTVGNISVLLGNGNGTFAAHTTYAAGNGSQQVSVGDFDGNGISDLAVANFGSDNISILLGNGDGTFAAHTTYAAGGGPRSVSVGDFDGDGISDLAVANFGSDNISVLLGNGDGTFGAQTTFAVGNAPQVVSVGDFDGDGILDLAAPNNGSNNVSVLLGNGDGTFQTHTTYGVGIGPGSVTIGDLNGDGIPDLATANGDENSVSVLFGNANEDTPDSTGFSTLQTLSGIDLSTVTDAKDSQDVIDIYFDQTTDVLSAIGSGLSRFSVAAQNLQNQSENVAIAASRIMDVDVAEESARLASSQIRQQAAGAVLALANQQPELVLKLLSDD